MLEEIDDLENIPPYALPEPKRLNVGGLLTKLQESLLSMQNLHFY